MAVGYIFPREDGGLPVELVRYWTNFGRMRVIFLALLGEVACLCGACKVGYSILIDILLLPPHVRLCPSATLPPQGRHYSAHKPLSRLGEGSCAHQQRNVAHRTVRRQSWAAEKGEGWGCATGTSANCLGFAQEQGRSMDLEARLVGCPGELRNFWFRVRK